MYSRGRTTRKMTRYGLKNVCRYSRIPRPRSSLGYDPRSGSVARPSTNALDALQERLGLAGRIVLRNEVVEFLQVPLGILGQQDLVAHQARALLPRRRLITCSAEATRPFSICTLPRARILSRANVSWVSS